MIFQTGYVIQKCRLIFALKFSIVDPIVIRHLAISVSFALAFNTLASPTHFMVLSLSILLRLSLFAFTYKHYYGNCLGLVRLVWLGFVSFIS